MIQKKTNKILQLYLKILETNLKNSARCYAIQNEKCQFWSI